MQYSCSIAVHKTRLSMFYAFKFRLMMTMVHCSLLLLRWGRGVVVAVALSSPVAPGLSLSQPTVPPWRQGRRRGGSLVSVSVFIVYYMYIYLISRWLALITNKSYCLLFLVSTLNKGFLSYLILSLFFVITIIRPKFAVVFPIVYTPNHRIRGQRLVSMGNYTVFTLVDSFSNHWQFLLSLFNSETWFWISQTCTLLFKSNGIFFCNVKKWLLNSMYRFAILRVVLRGVSVWVGKIS